MSAELLGIFLFWIELAYKLRLANFCLKIYSKPLPKTPRMLSRWHLGLLFNYSGCGTYTCSQASPGVLNEATVSKQKLGDSFFVFLALKTNPVPPKTLLWTDLPFGSPQRESAHFRGNISCDYSNHLDVNSAWKLLVAGCVCTYVCMYVCVCVHMCGWNFHGYTFFHSRHFVACHFVAGTLRHQLFGHEDTWSPTILLRGHFLASHFVAGPLRHQQFCPGDTLSPMVLSRGHFVDGGQGWRTKTCRQRWWMKSA